ncbi:MAG: PaaI family thioesterase [Deltaproteobacteria bacterium]|nr:PaaI family thioesterase [Deltaproteobacteria bacterium]
MKPIPNHGSNDCFGCGANNPHGLQMDFFTDGDTVHSTVIVPAHLSGWNQVTHGGVVSTILDEIMAWGAIYLLKRITLTKSMSIEYLKAVPVDEELKVTGRVLEKINRRDVRMEGLLTNSKGALLAKSIGTFAMFDPPVAKRLGIMNEWDIEHFFKPILEL